MIFRCFGVFNQWDVAPVTDGAHAIGVHFADVNQVISDGVSALSRQAHTCDGAVLEQLFAALITMDANLNVQRWFGVQQLGYGHQ